MLEAGADPRPVIPEGETLASLQVGERGIVLELHCAGLTRRRLLDLGLVPGTEVEAVMASPLGDPVTYLVRGAMLALRSEDAGAVRIARVDDAGG